MVSRVVTQQAEQTEKSKSRQQTVPDLEPESVHSSEHTLEEEIKSKTLSEVEGKVNVVTRVAV